MVAPWVRDSGFRVWGLGSGILSFMFRSRCFLGLRSGA